MAFRDWLTSDGVFMPLYPWFSAAGSKFIEHGHRLLAMSAGCLTIALVISLWLAEPRRWVRWYGAALLAAVVFQGVLGGQRVLLDHRAPDQARLIALIHGCTGPLFFAAAVGMAVVTSRQWLSEQAEPAPINQRLFRLAALTTALTYLQLVVGAIVRHSPLLLSERAAAVFQAAVYFHVALAAAVTFHVLWLALRCCRAGQYVALAIGLAGLIIAQVLLGISSWVVKYGVPSWATRRIGETGHINGASDVATAAILAGHGAVGSLVVALTLVIAMRAGRKLGWVAPALAAGAARTMGGVA
jgi:cytochrome c oxidase assembly protein subunit 15